MKIKIRPATLSDLPALREMEQGIIRDERPYDPTIRQDPVHYYDLPALIADPDCYFLVAEANQKLVSTGYVQKKTPRHYLDHEFYAYLGFMYTVPEQRGKGINGLLISDLKKWAREHGLKEFRLTVYENNLPAIRAYQKVGFSRHLIEMRYREE
ncbi:GNAT family N-acetyltransferase [Robiginitalea sp. IMCC44478]|uniref:GNAT family N-acetyltransferase n=1 Tax=Robiginitalea sp. IMCC44478 TaxID=3459122 RepID=UPI004040FF02